MYIVLTYVDFVTRIPCYMASMNYGPYLPEDSIKDLQIEWSNKSKFPIPLLPDGTYSEPALFFGMCADDAEIPETSLMNILTKDEYDQARYDEYIARRPFNSWIGDEKTMVWVPPILYPIDNNQYVWDESSISWKPLT